MGLHKRYLLRYDFIIIICILFIFSVLVGCSTPGPDSDSLDHFTFTTNPRATETAGEAIAIVVEARDSNDNLVDTYVGPATLSDTTGTISEGSAGGGDTTLTFVGGIYNDNVYITEADTAVTITISDGVASGVSSSFTVDPAVTITNLKNNNKVESGFILGTTSDDVEVTSVEIKLDNGSYDTATGTTSWIYQLPTGTNTWKPNSAHTITVRAKDNEGNYSEENTITVRKGTNKDINGDGYADIVVGADSYSSYQGRAYIFHGGPSGISDKGAGSANTTLTGEAIFHFFGWSVALGDVNGDGYADVVVGAFNYDALTKGRAYIFHGGPSGISDKGAGLANTTLTGKANSTFGYSVSFGDVNGDGYADVVVGATTASNTKGEVYIFLGSSFVSNQDLSVTGTANTTFTGEVDGDNLGTSVELGDINGDTYDDVITGAESYSPTNKGAAYIFHGGSTGISNKGAGLADTTLIGPSGSKFGGAVAVGDVNGDGNEDVAVGAVLYVDVSNEGAAFIFHGNSSGISDYDLSGIDTADTTITGEASSKFGYSIALGDVNGDGYADVVAGATLYSSKKGRVYIFQGSSSGISSQDLSSGGSANTTLTGEIANDELGRAVAISDVNGDGHGDAVTGAGSWVAGTIGHTYIFHRSS